MSDHAAIARDQLRLAQDQLRLIDESAETAHDQLLVFLAAAIVHSNLAILEAMKTPKASAIRPEDVYQQLVDESAGYKPAP